MNPFTHYTARLWLAGALLLALVFLTAVPSARAQGIEDHPGYQELVNRYKKAFTPLLPRVLVGLERGAVQSRTPGRARAKYSGEGPFSFVGIMLMPASDGPFGINEERMESKMEDGNASIDKITRNGRTLYLEGIGEATQGGMASIKTFPGRLYVQIVGKVPDGSTPDETAIRERLLRVFDGLNAERLAAFQLPRYPVSGRIEVSGGVETAVEITEMGLTVRNGETTTWSVNLENPTEGVSVTFYHLPFDIEPGTYPLDEAVILERGQDIDELDVPIGAEFERDPPDSAFNDTWDKDVTGTLTIEAVEDGKISGRFQFSADGYAPDVHVKGTFKQVEIFEGE